MIKLLLEEALFEEDAEEVVEEQPTEVAPAEEEATDDETYGPVQSIFGDDEQTEEPQGVLYKVEFVLGNFNNWSRVNAESEEDAKQQVTDYVTKKWPNRDFEITEVHEFTEEDEKEIEENLEEDLNESLNENMMGEYSDKFFELLRNNEGDENFLSALCYDLIRFCPEEDLKDLWKRNEDHYIQKETNFDNEELDEAWNDYRFEVSCNDGPTKTIRTIADSEDKAIKYVKDMYAKEHTTYADDRENKWNIKNLDESLTEAEPIETGAAVGMATVVGDLIKDEYEAIEGYNSAIATAESEGFEDAVKVLTEIQAEEHLHVGQLLEVMKLFDPNAEKVEDGQIEGAEQLGELVPTEE